MLGVWMAPVTAQEMMILDMAASPDFCTPTLHRQPAAAKRAGAEAKVRQGFFFFCKKRSKKTLFIYETV
jgi:hypothetical protein